jgi:putative sugar O-methyltransferase
MTRTPWPIPPVGPRLLSTTEAQLRWLYYRYRLEELAGRRLGTVLEIGGGYGGLAVELLTKSQMEWYFFVELPDTLPLTWFYARACLGDNVAIAYTPQDVSKPNAQLVLLPPWLLPAVTGRVDLIVNTVSFNHMDRRNLNFYFGEIGRLQAKRLYLVNRNWKREPTDVAIDDYPIPSEFKLVDDQPWLLAPHVRERTYLRTE